MRPTEPAPQASRSTAVGPRWQEVVRALREARGVTQDGWAAQIGVSRKTVQRWEAGERAPDPGAEAAILAYCGARGLFRPFRHGPLAGLELTPDLLHDLLAGARLSAGRQAVTATEGGASPGNRAPDESPAPAGWRPRRATTSRRVHSSRTACSSARSAEIGNESGTRSANLGWLPSGAVSMPWPAPSSTQVSASRRNWEQNRHRGRAKRTRAPRAREADLVTARTHLQASVALRRELGDKRGVANALDDLATIAGMQGDAARQMAELEEKLALYRELGATRGVARVLNYLGMTAWLLGDYRRAMALLEESLALYRDRSETRGIAGALGNLGLVALSRRDFGRAERLCRESVALYRSSGDAWGASHHLVVLAGAAFGQGQSEKAVRLCAAAAMRERLGTPLPPPVQPDYDRMIAAMRRTLVEQAFDGAWAAGEALSWNDAIAEALTDASAGCLSSTPRGVLICRDPPSGLAGTSGVSADPAPYHSPFS